MKILLLNPSPSVFSKSSVVPLGLAYLGAVLEENDFDVKVFDMQVENLKEKIFDWPDVLGITSSTPSINHALKIAEKAKKINPNLKIFLGGPHPSALPHECKKDFIDGVVIGEGEQTFLETCKAIEKKKSLANIRGLYTGKSFKLREHIKNLDSIPFPAYHLFKYPEKYGNAQPFLSNNLPCGSIITSRGCPFKCLFCFKGIYGSTFRPRSPENVVKEWRFLVDEFRVREIAVQDDIFNFDIKRAERIFQLLRKEKLDVPWVTPNGMKPNYLNRSFLFKMKNAGCYRTAFGVESGNQEILNKMRKGTTIKMILNAFRLCREARIKTMAFFILGMPYENKKTMSDTINFSKKLDPDYAQFCIAAPFPGTELYELVRTKGRLLVDDYSKYDQMAEGKAYFEIGDVKKELVEQMYRKAYREFYLRPRVMLRFMTDRNMLGNLPNFMQAALHYLGMKR